MCFELQKKKKKDAQLSQRDRAVTSCYNIVSNFHVNTFYVYKLSYFGTRCEILGS